MAKAQTETPKSQESNISLETYREFANIAHERAESFEGTSRGFPKWITDSSIALAKAERGTIPEGFTLEQLRVGTALVLEATVNHALDKEGPGVFRGSSGEGLGEIRNALKGDVFPYKENLLKSLRALERTRQGLGKELDDSEKGNTIATALLVQYLG